MTVTPWSDAAKALVGVAFGNPAMRSEQEKADLERQKVEIQNKQYMLEEALNPAKIGQAEAAARYNNAQAQSEGVEMMMKQLKLDAQKRRIDGVNNPPTMAPMPAYNPMNIGPQGQGRNPAMTLPYDQIEPLDMVPQLNAGAVSDEAFDAQQVTPLPVGAPYNPATMPSGPNTADPFDELIAGLTGGPAMPPQPVPLAPMEAQGSAQPQDMTQMLTPEIVDMMAAGWLPGQNIGDYLLAQEGFAANQGVTDPNKRILNAAAGRGTFASPDQVTAQAMGSTLPTARLSELGVQNMGTADMKNYEKTLIDPNYGPFLAEQNAGTQTTISYDANGKPIVTMGKGGKPPTEAQGKYSIAANQLARPIKYLESIGDFVPKDKDYYIAKTILENPLTAPTAVRNMSPEAQRYFQAMKPVVAQAIFLQSGQAATEAEVMRKTLELTAVPGEDVEVTLMKRLAKKDLFDTVRGLGAPALPGTPLGDSDGGAPAAPVQIQSDEEYEALPSGATFLAPDGTTRTKP